MINIQLSLLSIAQYLNEHNLGAQLIGDDISFEQLSIDSRTVKQGNLYVAIDGEKFDGHDFISEAIKKGAIACVVEKPQNTLKNITQLVVKDCKFVLAKIAFLWQQQWKLLGDNKTIIAITGSCGKTTVKEMVASIARQLYEDNDRVLLTKGNLNNEFGVPLTLMRLNKNHQIAVIEMGANHQKEIAYLTEIVRPDIAIITNAGNAHIEGFGSIESVAKGKGELFSALVEHDVAIVNNDDNYASYWKSLINDAATVKTFALDTDADINAVNSQQNKIENNQFIWQVKTANEQFNVKLPVPGKHNLHNALAAIAVGKTIGATTEQIQLGLQQFKNVTGRLEISQRQKKFILINDTYNANPDSVKAAIDVLSAYQGKRQILVLGDMAELGVDGQSLHQQIGEYAATKGINEFYSLGKLSHLAAQKFALLCSKKQCGKEQGKINVEKRSFNKLLNLSEHLINALKQNQQGLGDTVILVKGSRKMAMEVLVKDLEELL